MAVALDLLYKEIINKHNIRLQTTSCFEKTISWLHLIENVEFVSLLHGDELVFNSMLNDASEEERIDFVKHLIDMEAGGLVVSLREGCEFSPEMIAYCNSHNFPLFATSWETAFINIMRRFSEMILDSERKDLNVTAAFKNAIYYPQDTSQYVDFLMEAGFSNDTLYTISILNFEKATSENSFSMIKRIKKQLRSLSQCIILEEKQQLILFTENSSLSTLNQQFICLQDSSLDFFLAIGSAEQQLVNIHRSYQNAKISLELLKTMGHKTHLSYSDIGAYQILADVREKNIIFPQFVENTLGRLIAYDDANHTHYMDVLADFFENDCSITQTANATFYHQNTLKYKIKNIKEILGYDIMTNENRVKIMLSLYILKMGM